VTIADRLRALDRVQRTKLFKLIASAAVVLLAVGLVVASVVADTGKPMLVVETPAESSSVPTSPDVKANEDAQRAAAEQRTAIEEARKVLSSLTEGRRDPTTIGVAAVSITALLLVVIWLGLGLTYLGLIAAAAGVVGLAMLSPALRPLAQVVGGIAALGMAFAALLRVLQAALAGSGPVMAVARNTLAEAVRMRVSLVFIVLLMLSLASLPLLLNDSTPLRYRVQSFLQYGTSGAFWIIALLVVTFSCASVAFEQRDKLIWQTMTKPVQAWQYILGKWIGVAALSAVLLGVSATGVFLFTEYLRNQKAYGERAAFVPMDDQGISEDRLILETQVLTARMSARIDPPEIDMKTLDDAVRSRVEEGVRSDPNFDNSPRAIEAIRESLLKSYEQLYRSVPPAEGTGYVFSGLSAARESGRFLTLRYKFDLGSNRPDETYRVTFLFRNAQPIVREIIPGQRMSLTLTPTLIGPDGTLDVAIFNGDAFQRTGNEADLRFAPDGLDLTYSVGTFQGNFLRVTVVLWLKLVMLAIVSIWSATYLSFAVAALVSVGVFLAAEAAGFIRAAVENFPLADRENNTLIFNVVVSKIAEGVAGVFSLYDRLNPTERLVQGELLPWSDLALGGIYLVLVSIGLFALASYIFRRRELATYSGQ
jgi:ABC-type transport system involved in multi-copper enzyme maturation permease subunit